MQRTTITLRPLDVARLAAIRDSLDSTGLTVGRCSVSEAVRYAIELAYHQREAICGEEQATGTAVRRD